MEFLRFFTSDGVELTGLLYDGGKDTVVIHLHGWVGNFYENEFVQVLGKELSKNSISFFAVNTRAHDYRCDLRVKTIDGYTSITGGGAVDDFYSAYIDIKSTVEYLKSLGYKRVIVQGHSTAAQKALYYAIKDNAKDVILLSAGDIYSEIAVSNKNSKEAFAEAYSQIASGNPKSYLKESLWGLNFTAEALVNGFGDGAPSDLFPIRTGKPNPIVQTFKNNVLNVLGDNDAYLEIYSNATVAEKYFAESFVNANYTFCLLHDGHSFAANPQKLAEVIINWCSKTN